MKFSEIALAVFLVLTGFALVTNFRIEYMGFLTGIAAIVAAVLMFLKR